MLLDRRAANPQQKTNIDLCAGFQSIKPWALKNGFNYVAVDVLGDRNLRRCAAAAAALARCIEMASPQIKRRDVKLRLETCDLKDM